MSSRYLEHKFRLKNDRYRKERGGMAKFLNVSCTFCDTWLLLYQKDGRGNLLRFYLNRIFVPSSLAELQNRDFQRFQNMGNLICHQCGNLIGTPMLHSDNRLAYRLKRGSFFKEKSDGTYLELLSEIKDKE